MNLKPCLPPPIIQKFEAVIRRIEPDDPKLPEILNDYKNRMKGYKGQKSLEFYLDQLSKKYDIIHDLRLFDGKYYFQIDILVLSNLFLLDLEAKNRNGEMVFERDLNQATIVKNNKRERIPNPVIQARTQAKKLRKFLQDHNCPILPIHYLFVNSNDKMKITLDPRNYQINQNICNGEGLIEKIDQIEKQCTEKISQKELRKITRLLLASHVPENPDILQYLNISPKSIPTGVQCECKFIPMEYRYGIWMCPICGKKSSDAHIQAINDYFLIFRPSITNAELREFLHIDSINIAKKILKKMNLPYTGKFKDRVYYQAPISGVTSKFIKVTSKTHKVTSKL